jgi:hypothetical protein
MSEIENTATNRDGAVRLLRDGELDAVSGGLTGLDGGCIGPWRAPDGTLTNRPPMGSNPWLPGGSQHR